MEKKKNVCVFFFFLGRPRPPLRYAGERGFFVFPWMEVFERGVEREREREGFKSKSTKKSMPKGCAKKRISVELMEKGGGVSDVGVPYRKRTEAVREKCSSAR